MTSEERVAEEEMKWKNIKGSEVRRIKNSRDEKDNLGIHSTNKGG